MKNPWCYPKIIPTFVLLSVVGLWYSSSLPSYSSTSCIYVTAETTDAVTINAMTKTKQWVLYHRLWQPSNGTSSSTDVVAGQWEERGTIELTVKNNNQNNMRNQEEEEEDISIQITNKEGVLTKSLATAMMTTKKGYYQLKLVSNSSAGSDNGNINSDKSVTTSPDITTSVLACDVRRANFRDEFVLQLQQGTGMALSLSYMPLVSPLAPTTCEEYTQLPDSSTTSLAFDSKIAWETDVPGMIVGRPTPIVTTDSNGKVNTIKIKPPPGLKWIPGAPKNTDPLNSIGGGTAPPPPPEGMMGMLQRYWYIVLPLLLMNLLGAAAPEGQPQAVPTAATTTATAAAGATMAAQSQRRGKRD